MKRIVIIIIGVIGLVAIGIAIPSFMQARTQGAMNACINNLRQIEAAKDQWALATHKPDEDMGAQGYAKYAPDWMMLNSKPLILKPQAMTPAGRFLLMIPITTIFPLTNVVAAVIHPREGQSIEITDLKTIKEIHSYFVGGYPIPPNPPYLGCYEYAITFRRNDGSEVSAASFNGTHWCGLGEYYGDMNDGWDKYIKHLVSSEQSKKANTNSVHRD